MRNSYAGISTSGAVTRRAPPTARIRRCSAIDTTAVRTPLEALLARSDAAAWDYLTERLTLNERSIRIARRSTQRVPDRELVEIEG